MNMNEAGNLVMIGGRYKCDVIPLHSTVNQIACKTQNALEGSEIRQSGRTAFPDGITLDLDVVITVDGVRQSKCTADSGATCKFMYTTGWWSESPARSHSHNLPSVLLDSCTSAPLFFACIVPSLNLCFCPYPLSYFPFCLPTSLYPFPQNVKLLLSRESPRSRCFPLFARITSQFSSRSSSRYPSAPFPLPPSRLPPSRENHPSRRLGRGPHHREGKLAQRPIQFCGHQRPKPGDPFGVCQGRKSTWGPRESKQ